MPEYYHTDHRSVKFWLVESVLWMQSIISERINVEESESKTKSSENYIRIALIKEKTRI